jgi:hypothetical protein
MQHQGQKMDPLVVRIGFHDQFNKRASDLQLELRVATEASTFATRPYFGPEDAEVCQ